VEDRKKILKTEAFMIRAVTMALVRTFREG
jgi:hypothetical protein